MIWADRTIGEIKERFAKEIAAKQPLIIRDEKTLSGRVHVGSLRGIVIHGLIAQILQSEGVDCKFLFELNDFDPMDGLSEEFESLREHMGKPLFTIPSPEKGHENYSMVFGDELKGVVERLNLPIEFYTLRPLYEEGKFNDCIRDALGSAAEIRKIYEEVSGGGKPDDWYPLQVVCEKCGKIGTTQVTGWDGEKVTYACKKDLVDWAEGCGHEGEISPFDGRAKLPWKVEWAAKWKVMGVQIEGCGKDHSAAGGSRSVAAKISEDVFKYPNPFDIPYEWINVKGRSMSSSHGRGISAKEISDLIPPILLKLLMIRTVSNRPIDFDPEGKTIPNLFDEYDRLSDHYFKRHKEPDEDFARTFKLTQLDTSVDPVDLWQMRFSAMIFVVQMPHLDLVEEAGKLKFSSSEPVVETPDEAKPRRASPGEQKKVIAQSLTKDEVQSLNDRALYVKKWLESLAPEEYKYQILDEPPKDLKLDDDQKAALEKIAKALTDESLQWEGPAIHERIHKVKEETGISPKALFQPLYQIFLGRNSGPQVGWFLSTIERNSVLKSIKQVL